MVKRLHEFPLENVDQIIRMKYLKMVDSKDNVSYVSNKILGQIFGTSRTTINTLITNRIE